ncbi:MAG: hypothetical protein ACLFTT_04080 [Candidatus Hydrogenedentota bacterium]
MAAHKPIYIDGEIDHGSEMVWSETQKSLHRGRRRAPRTEVFRPCLVWLQIAPQLKLQGVVMDLTPYGLRVRLIEHIPPGTAVAVQMMRDEEFAVPLSPPLEATIVRNEAVPEGLTDHGLRVEQKPIKQTNTTRPISAYRSRTPRRPRTRMHTLDVTLGNRGSGGYGRRG